jgi:hypothetical protein
MLVPRRLTPPLPKSDSPRVRFSPLNFQVNRQPDASHTYATVSPLSSVTELAYH